MKEHPKRELLIRASHTILADGSLRIYVGGAVSFTIHNHFIELGCRYDSCPRGYVLHAKLVTPEIIERITVWTAKAEAYDAKILAEIKADEAAQYAARMKQDLAHAERQRQESASAAQIAHLRRLGVDVSKPLSKYTASKMIDSAKAGEGVGSWGGEFTDGSL